jgi:hypothetical protein
LQLGAPAAGLSVPLNFDHRTTCTQEAEKNSALSLGRFEDTDCLTPYVRSQSSLGNALKQAAFEDRCLVTEAAVSRLVCVDRPGASFPPAFAGVAAAGVRLAADSADALPVRCDYSVGRLADDQSARVAQADGCRVKGDLAAADWAPSGCSAAADSVQDDLSVGRLADDHSARVAQADGCWVKGDLAAADWAPSGCSAAADSVQDDLSVEWLADDHSAQVALADGCRVKVDLAAADLAPGDCSAVADSVQDDCSVERWADDHFALVTPRDDYSAPLDCSERGDSMASDWRRDGRSKSPECRAGSQAGSMVH